MKRAIPETGLNTMSSVDDGISSFEPQQSKQPRSERVSLRFLIPTKAAGSLIGKNGCNIKTLRSDPLCSARVPECAGPERVFTISHTSMDACLIAVEQAMNFLTEEAVNRARDEPQDAKDIDEHSIELRLLVNQSIVGGIIGQGGRKIQKVRELTDAKVRVFKETCPMSTDRAVSIKGSVCRVKNALRMIIKEVEESAPKVKLSDALYNPSDYDVLSAAEYGGWGSEGDAHSDRRGQYMDSSLRSPGGRYNSAGADFNGTRRMYPPQRSGGRPSPSAAYGSLYANRSPYGRSGGPGRGPSSGLGYDNYDREPVMPAVHGPPSSSGPQEKTAVTITKDMAGAIIGIRGDRIRRIRQDSQATINIGDPMPGTEERIVTIYGTKEQIAIAQYLMQHFVKVNSNSPMAY